MYIVALHLKGNPQWANESSKYPSFHKKFFHEGFLAPICRLVPVSLYRD